MQKLLVCILSVFFCAGILYSVVDKDNKAVLETLKASAMTQIDQNQKRINGNKDGTVGDKGLTSTWFGKASYRQFKTMSKSLGLSVKDFEGSHDKEQLAQILTTYLAAARIVVAKAQKKINTDADGTVNPKQFYPAVFGRLTAEEFLNRSGIALKQTTTGKGLGARNQYNKPDGWETKVLNKFESSEWVRGQGFGEKVAESGNNYYRFVQPLEIKKACLGCHGDPKGDKDISGHTKEGYSLNDVRGGISVKIPVK